eukprot:gene12522-14482_t
MDMVSRDHIDAEEGDQTYSSVSRVEMDSVTVVSEPGSGEQKAEEATNPEKLTIETSPSDKAAPPALLVPSLKGKMTYEGGNVTCKGAWGMSDYAHNFPAQLSEFEFKLVKADEDSSLFPVNGRYQGHFYLKQAPPLKGSVKVEDKEMVFKFVRSEDVEGQYMINGNGLNKFGSFTLKGTLSEDGDLHVYREYYNLTPLPGTHVKRRLSIDGDSEGPRSKKKALAVKAGPGEDIIPLPPMDPNVSPREGAGRVRKQSLAMKEYAETAVKAPTSVPKPAATPKVEPAPLSLKQPKTPSQQAAPVPLMRQDSSSDRAHRLSFPLKKCSELLKEMSKQPHAAWFLEPVDYVRFNIPDYPLIISTPMDFSTIRKRIEGSLYDTAEAFAEDMRLVFRNAITFNTQRDNPVHIAAREMSGRFEDRYRVLTSQLAGTSAYSAAAILAVEAGNKQVGGMGPSSGKKNKTPRPSLGGKSSSGAGPRQSLGGVGAMPMGYLPPVVDSGSAHQLMEMQRMMQAMQNEISTLKSQVRENEIVKRLQETKDASHNPLTFEEKKTLIAQIHKLAPDRMEHVLNIIQDALPPRENDDDAEIEIPLDALDTFTLRKLQKFIEDNSEKKKRAPPALQRQSSGGGAARSSSSSNLDGQGAPKRARKPSTAGRASAQQQHTLHGLDAGELDLHHGGDGDLELFQDEGEEMLFEPDSFEELKAHAQRDAQHHHSNSPGDDADFRALANMNHSAPIDANNNLNAWNQ